MAAEDMLRSSRASSVDGILETGTDSPGSMLSFTMQAPERRRLSHGICVRLGSVTSYTSPGTRSPEAIERQKPLRRTLTSHSNLETSLNRFIVALVSIKVVVMLTTEMAKMQAA